MIEFIKKPDLSQEVDSPQKAVRAFVVSLAKPEEILESLKQGKNFSCLRFYLGVKGGVSEGDGKEPSFKKKERFTLLGGKVDWRENPAEAVQREVMEEIGGFPIGFKRAYTIGKYRYKIGGGTGEERFVTLTIFPLLPVSKDDVVIGDKKIQRIEVLTLAELKKLIIDGNFKGIPIEEHLSISSKSSSDFYISAEDEKKRERQMQRIINFFEIKEKEFEKELGDLIKRSTNDNGFFDEDKFKSLYEELKSKLMRIGLELNKKNKNKNTTEERGEKHSLAEVLSDGFLGKDILYYLPEIASHRVDWPGLQEAPEGVRIFVEFLKSSLKEFLEKPIQLSSGEINSFSLEEYKDFLLNGEIIDISLVINEFDHFFKEKLKIIFGVSDERIQDNKSKIDGFLRELTQEIKTSAGLYQEYTLVNEVQNASLGRLVHLFLGLEIKKNTPYAEKLIRFEAGRQLLLNLKGLSLIERFYQLNNKIQEGSFQLLFERFFGSIEGEKIIEMDNDRSIRIRLRKGNIYDEKPTKTFGSYLRKSFEEKPDDIKDVFNINIIPIEQKADNPVGFIKNLIDEMVYFLRQNSKKEIKVSKIKWYGTENFQAGKPVIFDGKRQGSQGDRLVRGKVIIEEVGGEILELVVYPYFSLKDDESGYWGWKEKIEDDKYYTERRLLSGENGLPSFYDLLFPPILYPRHFEHRLNSVYHK